MHTIINKYLILNYVKKEFKSVLEKIAFLRANSIPEGFKIVVFSITPCATNS